MLRVAKGTITIFILVARFLLYIVMVSILMMVAI